MSERTSDYPDMSGSSTRATTSRRVFTVDQRCSPQRRVAQLTESDLLRNDVSYSEDRYLSPSSMSIQAQSWESHSFDESEEGRPQPSSRMNSMRDRRKQFDTTTPTLIDEEDVPEEEEIVSLERGLGLRSYTPKDESSMRRTPGASMYKTSFEETETSAPDARKTPGPDDSLHNSAWGETHGQGKDAALGFGLTLASPVGGDGNQKGKERVWESYPNNSSARTLTVGTSMEVMEQTTRPPLAPAVTTGATLAVSAGSKELRGPFSFTPWNRAKSPTYGVSSEGRAGAYSPNILRLTEDIGNLLHEDEDDDFALEIPSAFRAEGEEETELNSDWTGSYVFDKEIGRRQSKGSYVQRSGTFQKDGKSRRRTGSSHGSFFPNAQQPKPRRVGDDVFEFGMARPDDRASPQLLNFGGAFAPPANSGSFRRPVPSSAMGAPGHFQTFAPLVVPQQGVFNPSQVGVAAPQSFDSYQPPHTGHHLPHLTRSSGSPSPQLSQASEMQATAREFVPMSTRSLTPQYFNTRWQQSSPAPYEPAEHSSWHASAGLGYAAGFRFGVQSQSILDSRSTMTPSPAFPSWQPVDVNFYGSIPVHQAEQSDSSLLPQMSQAGTAAKGFAGSDPSQAARGKKDIRRGKRGKKKPGKLDNLSTIKKQPVAAATAATKKKNRNEPARPGSTTQSQEGDEAQASVSEDLLDVRRVELVESPATRLAFKDFYRTFRNEERFSFQKAEEYARKSLEDGSLPESVHWRVYLELADLAKRSNRYVEARRLYQKVCQLQPYASQGWLEYSKLEEECGHMNRVTNILHAGLEYCEFSENLLTRAVKHQEKIGNLGTARELLARLKHAGIDKVWRTVLEGALLEARAGNIAMSRRVLKYLMHHVPWYGPLYLEAYRLERDQGHPMDALDIVERGLSAIPRYGPLWFGAFKLCEEIDIAEKAYHLPSSIDMIERATISISKELVWKVHLEAALMHERAATEQSARGHHDVDTLLAPARRRFALTVLTCPNNLRWKVWLAAARMELSVGKTDRARHLFLRAHRTVPDKGRPGTLLECARLEEFIGQSDLARAILCKGRFEYCHDWKVWLESVLLEIRKGNFDRAFELCSSSLEVHSGTGRLWATLIQLSQIVGNDETQVSVLKKALNAVPKSGEVWCEGGRLHLNPFSRMFDVERARRHLYFATKFTPQYGDSFIETLRLEVLTQWLAPIASFVWEETKSSFLGTENHDLEQRITKYVTDVSLAVSLASHKDGLDGRGPKRRLIVIHKSIIAKVRELLDMDNLRKCIDLTELRLSCANADPNYGSLWFRCRKGSTDTPRSILEGAAEDVAAEVRIHASIYLAAMVRRAAVLSTIEYEVPAITHGVVELTDPGAIANEDKVDELLRIAPSLREILNPLDPTTGLVLLESTIDGSSFVTGLTEMNKSEPIESMSLSERRRVLFGTDALFP